MVLTKKLGLTGKNENVHEKTFFPKKLAYYSKL